MCSNQIYFLITFLVGQEDITLSTSEIETCEGILEALWVALNQILSSASTVTFYIGKRSVQTVYHLHRKASQVPMGCLQTYLESSAHLFVIFYTTR